MIQLGGAYNVKEMYKELNVISVNQAHRIFKLATPLDVVDVRIFLYSVFDSKFLAVFSHLYINTLLFMNAGVVTAYFLLPFSL